jgi:hypothetical protein
MGEEKNLKTCSCCGDEFSLEGFHPRKDSLDGRRGQCRICLNTINNKSRLKRMYGMTYKDYNNMFSDQEGCCLICGKHQEEVFGKLVIDHDHETGTIRGLLCHLCNASMGGFRDSIDMLQKAIIYLTQYK